MIKENKRTMLWFIFALGAVISWGIYGAMLHQGQVKLGNPMRALLCVGVAYFLIGVVVPVIALSSQSQMTSSGFNMSGSTLATAAGALGAIGAVCIIYAFKVGGMPVYVMPIVFGGAPVVNVFVTMLIHPPKSSINPLLYVGFLLVVSGSTLVLFYRPQS